MSLLHARLAARRLAGVCAGVQTRSVSHHYGALAAALKGSAGAGGAAASVAVGDLPYVDTLRAEHLLRLRFHVGHQKRKMNRGIAGLLYGFRHNIAIYDIAKTWQALRTVFYGFSEMAQNRSSFYLLAPNSRLPLRPLIEKMRKEYPFQHNKFSSLYMVGYSDEKWVDGTFSNWKQTVAFHEHVKRALKEKPSLSKFRRLARYMRGIEGVDVMGRIVPDFVLVFAPDRGAIHEATNLDIPLVGMVDSNTNPRPFLYPVCGNDDSVESLQFMMDLLKRAVEEGRKREHEAFATMMVQKLKQKLDPVNATASPYADDRSALMSEELGERMPESERIARAAAIRRQPVSPRGGLPLV
ncbi:30S ribosomal protein S2 [archaeon]|nr:MAG: 30S ribosomal protein S2 [archaeon]